MITEQDVKGNGGFLLPGNAQQVESSLQLVRFTCWKDPIPDRGHQYTGFKKNQNRIYLGIPALKLMVLFRYSIGL